MEPLAFGILGESLLSFSLLFILYYFYEICEAFPAFFAQSRDIFDRKNVNFKALDITLQTTIKQKLAYHCSIFGFLPYP